MVITKKFSFDAAHRLHKVRPGHPCKNLHGHRYTVEVSIIAEGCDTMVVDYHDLACIKNYIDRQLDHATLVANEDVNLINLMSLEAEEVGDGLNTRVFGKVARLPIAETTAEMLSAFLQEVFLKMLDSGYILPDGAGLGVAVSETPNTSACQDYMYPGVGK